MQKTDNMPIWVFLAFSSIEKRTHALWLIRACVIFAFYCIPWALLFPLQTNLGKLFLIHDWSWFAMMLPIVMWYWLSLRWLDKNSAW